MSDWITKPFRGLIPHGKQAQAVIAPPYDVIDSNQAREFVTAKPNSFLYLSKPEVNFATAQSKDKIFAAAKQKLQMLLQQEILQQDHDAHYYVYRMQQGEHTQLGFAALVSSAAYEQGLIKQHEHTRPDKEAERVELLQALAGQLSPVLLSYPDHTGLNDVLQQTVRQQPLTPGLQLADVEHQLWRVDSKHTAAISQAFNDIGALYIADGHHRSAAAVKAGCAAFLAVICPASACQILPYHRLCNLPAKLSPQTFLETIAQTFSVTATTAAPELTQPYQYGLYLEQQWYRLALRQAPCQDDALDIACLHEQLIAPVLGITDVRNDANIDFVGGIEALAQLQTQVDNGNMSLALTCRAVSLAQLFATADRQQVLPPKSTWFEPKLADGLIATLDMGHGK